MRNEEGRRTPGRAYGGEGLLQGQVEKYQADLSKATSAKDLPKCTRLVAGLFSLENAGYVWQGPEVLDGIGINKG